MELEPTWRELPKEELDALCVALGEVLYERRLELDLSRLRAAEIVRVREATLWRIEMGQVFPSALTLLSIMDRYALDLQDVYAVILERAPQLKERPSRLVADIEKRKERQQELKASRREMMKKRYEAETGEKLLPGQILV